MNRLTLYDIRTLLLKWLYSCKLYSQVTGVEKYFEQVKCLRKNDCCINNFTETIKWHIKDHKEFLLRQDNNRKQKLASKFKLSEV